jgi:hypothetical protein
MKLIAPALPLSGGCSCEAVRFMVTEMPLLVYACHCTECQRWSGSAFSMSMPINAAAFAITCGEPKHWRRTGASGVESVDWFCGECGGRVFGQRRGRPDIVFVRAGTLDDTSWVRPVAHVYLRSAQPWERIPNHAQCFDVMPGDLWGLASKWQDLWDAG